MKPGTPTKAELYQQRDSCSKTCLELIRGFESLIDRFKRSIIDSKAVPDETFAEIAVAKERELIRKARRGR
jgi:hypothetical protein